MTEPIDLNAERERRQQPDAEFRMVDDFGRPMFQFLLDYKYDNASWSLHLWAYSEEDAKGRVAAMRDGLTYMGQIYTVVSQ